LTLFSGRPVGLDVQTVDATVTLDCAVSIGLILKELMTNAAKYAFPGHRNGKIQVVFTREGDQYRLTVADNGVGSTLGGSRQGTGLGLEMVCNMAKQLGGSFEMTARDGMTATACFPVLHCCVEEKARA
jgi:two-component system, sensor histidine kinase PdtaS